MATGERHNDESLAVVHCFRPLVGGVFRHVIDLAIGQAERGQRVGIVCASKTGAERAERLLAAIAPRCSLGVHRIEMHRRPHWSDVSALRAVSRLCRELKPHVIHGHGAKGGAFARMLPRSLGAGVVYTPHGGVLHYKPSSPSGLAYFALERYLRRTTDGLIFESRFGAEQYESKIGSGDVPQAIIHNGLHPEEFSPVVAADERFDFVFAGELRKLKGLSALLQATAEVARGRAVSLLMVGSGPDEDYVRERIEALGLTNLVTLEPPSFPVTSAFARGRVAIVPSLSESFPYIVLEALAAGMPLIATRVGGIPEIYGEAADRLLPAGDVSALSAAMQAMLDNAPAAAEESRALAARVRERFTVAGMVDATLAHYRRILPQA